MISNLPQGEGIPATVALGLDKRRANPRPTDDQVEKVKFACIGMVMVVLDN